MFHCTKHVSNSATLPTVNKGWGHQAPGQGPGATLHIHNLLKVASSCNVLNKHDICFRAMEKHEHNLMFYSPRWTGLNYLRPPMNMYLFTSKGNGVGQHKHHVVTKHKSDPTMVRHLYRNNKSWQLLFQEDHNCKIVYKQEFTDNIYNRK